MTSTQVPSISPAIEPSRRPLTSGPRLWAAGVLVLLIAAAMAIFLQQRTARQLRAMPAAERRALFERTLSALRATCLDTTSPGADHHEQCRDQATYLKLFPECDDACRLLADQAAPRAVH